MREGSLRSRRSLKVVLSSLSSDAHTWNLVFLQLLLEEMGHRVVNLGSCVPDDLLVGECLRHRPDAVVISTVNGHGHIDGLRAIRALRAEEALARTPVIIGGKLTIDGDASRVAADLLAAGYDTVFDDGSPIAEFRGFLDDVSRPALESP